MKTVILSVLWNYWIADLLARFQLWTTANKIIKLCHLPIVSSLNQQSTRIHVNCHRCNRPLQRVGWLCDRCKLVINNCSVWWGPTTSIFLITLILIIYHNFFLSTSYRGTSFGGGGNVCGISKFCWIILKKFHGCFTLQDDGDVNLNSTNIDPHKH